MNQGLIPSRYAKALFEAAAEKNVEARIFELMKSLAAAFEAEASLNDVMANPFVGAADKAKLLTTAAGLTPDDADASRDDARNLFDHFLRLLEDNKRLAMARDIALAYIKLYREKKGIRKVTVTSAAPLPEAEAARLTKLIAAHIGDATMEIDFRVDPELIGGFAVNIGNERLDASVAAQLKELRLQLGASR